MNNTYNSSTEAFTAGGVFFSTNWQHDSIAWLPFRTMPVRGQCVQRWELSTRQHVSWTMLIQFGVKCGKRYFVSKRKEEVDKWKKEWANIYINESILNVPLKVKCNSRLSLKKCRLISFSLARPGGIMPNGVSLMYYNPQNTLFFLARYM